MEARHHAAYTGMVYLRLTRDGIGDRFLRIGDAETGEVHAELEAEMEEFIIHIRPVLRYLGLCFGHEEQRTQRQNYYELLNSQWSTVNNHCCCFHYRRNRRFRHPCLHRVYPFYDVAGYRSYK